MSTQEKMPRYEDFIRFKSYQELEQFYQKRGFQSSKKKLLQKAREDWKTICIQRAENLAKKPEEFLPETVQLEDKTYYIYGLIHGLAGGDDAEYKTFVSKKIGALDYILFENGLNYFYPHQARSIIPDFMLFGVVGSFKIGLSVGLHFPLLLFTLLKEVVKPKKNEKKPAFMTCDPLYHGIDAETRRGLDDYPALPSQLQIQIEMDDWEQKRSNPADALVVPRSLFMAAFAHGFVESRQKNTANLVVGDLHTLEVAYFLKNLPQKHAIYQLGTQVGSLAPSALKRKFIFEKLKHLFSAGMGGVFGFIPYFIAVFFLLYWFNTLQP